MTKPTKKVKKAVELTPAQKLEQFLDEGRTAALNKGMAALENPLDFAAFFKARIEFFAKTGWALSLRADKIKEIEASNPEKATQIKNTSNLLYGTQKNNSAEAHKAQESAVCLPYAEAIKAIVLTGIAEENELKARFDAVTLEYTQENLAILAGMKKEIATLGKRYGSCEYRMGSNGVKMQLYHGFSCPNNDKIGVPLEMKVDDNNVNLMIDLHKPLKDAINERHALTEAALAA